MSRSSDFANATNYKPGDLAVHRETMMAAYFTAVKDEYEAARMHCGLFDRSDRGLIVARGADRKAWLHNVVTNAVKTVDDNQGNYAFATDVKGRTQFDMNILVLPEELWLDIDAATIAFAKAHLERYIITEKVELRDAAGEYARIGCAGPAAAHVATQLGVGNLTAMAALSSTWMSEGVRLFRHDLTGFPGFELVMPKSGAAACWDQLAGELHVRAVGTAAREALRIEAGIPAWGMDIDDKVIPPETGQIERGISYNKGCYLGQEVMERMRSLGKPARRLARIGMADGAALPLPAQLMFENRDAGRITSLVKHPERADWIGLGYLRSSLPDPAALTTGDPPRSVSAISTPAKATATPDTAGSD